MFLQNKYTKIYISLMEKARLRVKPEGYSERHHALPSCLGGDSSKTNIVRLTGREHYLAHLLLCKMTVGPNRRKMAFAFSRMNGASSKHQNKRLVPPARWYEYGRELLSEVQRNRVVTAETRAKVGLIASNRPPESIAKMVAAKSKPCTIDGIVIFPSKKAMGLTIGWGKSGTGSPTFRYIAT